MDLNIINGNKTYFIKYLFISIIIQISPISVKSDISKCSFYNTKNITELDFNTNITNESLVSDYNYIILANGSRVDVATHKRFCICPDPCLNFCANSTIDTYRDNSNMVPSYTLQLRNETDVIDYFDVVKYFNTIVRAPCEGYILNSTNDEKQDWILLENGSLYLEYSKTVKNVSQFCLQLAEDYQDGQVVSQLFPFVCSVPNNPGFYHFIKAYGMVFSVIFFLLTINIYYSTKRYQTCHGKCLIMYLIYLTIQYALICFVNLTRLEFGESICIAMGYSIYFSAIGFLTSACIISYHTYASLCHIEEPVGFRMYSALGLIVPTLMTLLIYFMQSLNSIHDDFKPGIEPKMCGVRTDRWSAMLYYYIPHIIILIYSLSLYVKVIQYIKENESGVAVYRGGVKPTLIKRFYLYFRILLFMGLIWFMEILSYFIEMILDPNDYYIIVIDIFNSCHGLYIFLTFKGKLEFCHNRKQSQHIELMIVDENS